MQHLNAKRGDWNRARVKPSKRNAYGANFRVYQIINTLIIAILTWAPAQVSLFRKYTEIKAKRRR
jgi:hypothetical protein